MSNLSVNAIRFLGIDAINKANSGHPGVVMGAAPMAYSLFTKQLRINPAKPNWINRDRFILSAGHGSMLLYALLHLSGFEDVSMDEIKSFRQWGSKTPGHPEFGHTAGIDATTGPLGQGISTATGFAQAERFLAAKYNREATISLTTILTLSVARRFDGRCLKRGGFICGLAKTRQVGCSL